MQKVALGELECFCDTVRYAHDESYYTRRILMISLFGPRNAVRAAWAHLVTKTRHGGASIHVGAQAAALAEGVKYVTIQTPTDRQMLHLVMIHPAATHQYSAFESHIVQIGPSPERGYFARLNRMSPVPFRMAWREWLWEKGLAEGLIKPLAGFGMMGYVIDTTEKWAKVVKIGLNQGEIE